jgi:hypothetical protein
MKKFLFILATLAMFIVPSMTKLSAQRFIDIIATNDTLTNQVTKVYTTSPTQLDVPYTYSIQVFADSLSGSNAGTAKLQVCNDRTGTTWSTLQTLTIDGTGTDEALWEGTVYARRIRVYYDMPSGTRKVRARVFGSFKRLN